MGEWRIKEERRTRERGEREQNRRVYGEEEQSGKGDMEGKKERRRSDKGGV